MQLRSTLLKTNHLVLQLACFLFVWGSFNSVSAKPLTPVTNYWIWNGVGNYTSTSFWNKGTVPSNTADSIIIQSGVCTLSQSVTTNVVKVRAGAKIVIAGINNLLVNKFMVNDGEVYQSGSTGGLIFMTTATDLKGTGTMYLPGITFFGPGAQFNWQGKCKVKWFSNFKDVVTTGNTEIRLVYEAGQEQGTFFNNNFTVGDPSHFVVEVGLDAATTGTTGAWYNIGPPIKNFRVGELETGNPFSTNTYNNAVAAGSSLYLYDPTDNTWPTNNGYIKATNANQTLLNHQGVRVWLSQAKVATGKLEFYGQPFTGYTQTFTLTYCASGCAYGTTNGYNLVKNPFIAALDWTSNQVRRTNVDNAYWVWRNNISNWAAWSGGVGVNGADGIIRTGQAFFVRANAANPMLRANYDATFGNTEPLLRRAAVSNVIRLKLSKGPQMQDEAAIRFEPSASAGYDQNFDAAKMMGSGASIGTMALGQKMAINTLPIQQLTVIPVTLSAVESGQQIGFSFESLDQDLEVYLNHPSWSNPQRIQDGQVIPTVANMSTGLELIVKKSGLTNLELAAQVNLQVYPNPAKGTFTVSAATPIASIHVLDAVGKQCKMELASSKSITIDATDLQPGAYMVQVKTQDGMLNSQRLIIQ